MSMRIIQVIEVKEVRGNGSTEPRRIATKYLSESGDLLWENDPCSQEDKDDLAFARQALRTSLRRDPTGVEADDPDAKDEDAEAADKRKDEAEERGFYG